ncbi:MAG: head-tail adaptor protein [Parasphingorhabdus sp.]
MKTEFAGVLRERIRIERLSAALDGLASGSSETELVAEFWAAIEAQGAGSEANAGSRSAMQRWRFILRQTDKILPGDRLIWSGRNMLIRSVSEDRRLLPRTILDAEEIR